MNLVNPDEWHQMMVDKGHDLGDGGEDAEDDEPPRKVFLFRNKKLARFLIAEFQKSRSDLRRKEIPTWKTSTGPLQDSTEDETQVQSVGSSAMRTSQKRNMENRLERRLQVLSVSKAFPLASYRRPAAGQILAITDQPDTLRTLLSQTVRQVIKYAISVSTYIKVTKTLPTFCGIFIRTTCELNQKAYADRMKEDIVFQKDVAGMV